MRILLLGANGQVGFELHRSLAPLGEVIAATREGTLPDGRACEHADLSERAALAGLVSRAAPDWIVNAAAYTAVDRAEEEPALAHRINGEALRTLGDAARARGAAVLHFSTDYVFDGLGTRPYREDDATNPVNAYGRSKHAGELALRESGARHLVFRTAWVHAARGRNFLRTMLRLARERERLDVVSDQRGAPTSARLIADVAAHALARIRRDAPSASFGVHHVTAAGETSWHGFATAVVDAARRTGLIERAPEVRAIAAASYPTPARRPSYSVLDTGRVERTLGLAMPDWTIGVAQSVAEIAEARR